MSLFEKIHQGNFLPKSFVDRLPIYAGNYNKLVDKLNTLFTSATSLAISVITTDNITSSDSAITASKSIIFKRTGTAVNATATTTAAAIKGGLLTSTSAAATTITLPTATQLGTALGATQGTTFDFVVDNTAGANTVTIAVGSGITAQSALTGGTTLTVSASSTQGIGVFRLTFKSATAAILSRIA